MGTNGRYELDYVEEEGGRLVGYESKWREKRWQPPGLFTQAYPGSDVHLVAQRELSGVPDLNRTPATGILVRGPRPQCSVGL